MSYDDNNRSQSIYDKWCVLTDKHSLSGAGRGRALSIEEKQFVFKCNQGYYGDIWAGRNDYIDCSVSDDDDVSE